MFHIAICDDEKYFQEREKNIIFNYMKQRNISCEIDVFSSGLEFLEKKDIHKYSIIFLDVNMKELDGLQTARKIRSISNKIHIVFVTAYILYALEGYKVNAIRYILKDDEFLENTFMECLDTIIQKLNTDIPCLTFPFKEGTKEIKSEQIVFVESSLHKLIFYLCDTDTQLKYTMYERLDVIAEVLMPYHFCRIHKSYLVNLKYVEMIERYQLHLKNGLILNIAKPRYPEVKKKFISYMGEL